MKAYQMDLFGASLPEYGIKNKIRLIECFGGIGAQARALEVLQDEGLLTFEHHKLVEWAVPSIIAYNAIHIHDWKDYSQGKSVEELVRLTDGISVNYNEPMTDKQRLKKGEKWLRKVYSAMVATHDLCPDISKTHWDDLGITERERYTYILTYSFPCVTENTWVLSRRGYVKFRDLKIGDEVLTKSNTWHKVVKQFDNGEQDVYLLKGMCNAGIECTKEHKFYVRRKFYNSYKQRSFSEPEMKHARDLENGDYLGIPVIQDEIPYLTSNVKFWELMGMYLGDGWVNNANGALYISGNEAKTRRIQSLCYELGYKYSTYQDNETCWRTHISSPEFKDSALENIGTGSHDKFISMNIINLPIEELEGFFNGYLETDGCIIGTFCQFTTVNERVAYSMSAIINKVFHKPCAMYKIATPNKHIIEGREVNQSDWYQLRFRKFNASNQSAFYEKGYIWFPFRKLDYLRKDHVYNMEIEEDHSYIINGTISANCQDLSAAGASAGFKKGSGTRSGLLWEIERILLECEGRDCLPHVLLMENVKQVMSDSESWSSWDSALRKMGYTNYVKVLNAKDYGIPQNRERCFMVSILGEYAYDFPIPFKRKHNLKDFLDGKVDKKYYLSDEHLRNIAGWKAQQKPIESMEKRKDCAPTLTARGAGEEHSGMVLVKDKPPAGDDILTVGNYGNGHHADGIMPTITTGNHGLGQAIAEKEVSNSIRVGGRGSLDRHQWDMVADEEGD